MLTLPRFLKIPCDGKLRSSESLILSNTKQHNDENISINGTARTDLGKKAVKGLRKQGLIPAVLNGGELVELPYQGALKPCEKLVELPGGKKGIIVTDFTVTKDAVRKLVYTPDIFAVELTIDGEKRWRY